MVFLEQLVPVDLSSIDLSLKPPLVIGLELLTKLNFLAQHGVDAIVNWEKLSFKNFFLLLSPSSSSIISVTRGSSAICESEVKAKPSVVESIYSRPQGALLSLKP